MREITIDTFFTYSNKADIGSGQVRTGLSDYGLALIAEDGHAQGREPLHLRPPLRPPNFHKNLHADVLKKFLNVSNCIHITCSIM